MTDLHALIHRMADELDHYRQLLTDDRRELHPLATEARAALAESDGPAVPDGREPAAVVGEPSDEKLLRVAANGLGYLSTPPWDFEAVPMNADDVLTIVRAAFACWGTSNLAKIRSSLGDALAPPAPAAGDAIQAYQAGRRDAEADAWQAAEAAEGEVVELVAFLTVGGDAAGVKLTTEQCRRIARLLQQHYLYDDYILGQ